MTLSQLADFLEAEETLNHELEQHSGKWVAICGHEIVRVADTLEQLIEATDGQIVERRFKVRDAGGARVSV